MLISRVLDAKGRAVATVLPTDSVEQALHKLAELGIGAVVVQDRWQKMVGLFSERDLVRLLRREGGAGLGRVVGQVMTRAVITCRPTDRIDAALSVMTMHKVRHLPVLDGTQLVGIVSIGDLVKFRLDEKELEAGVLLEIARMRIGPAEQVETQAPHA